MIRRLLLLSLAVTAAAQDKAEIDNAWVRVLRMKLAPHEKIALHQHPATVAVFLTDVHEKITAADGTVRNLDRKAGEVGFNEANKHAEENVSDQPLEAVIIELKPGAPKAPPITLDPVKLDAEHHPVAFENHRVRVLRDRDLQLLSAREMRHIRGKEIALILQSAVASLNPALRIGTQLAEAWKAHQSKSGGAWRGRALEIFERVSLPADEAFLNRFVRHFDFLEGQWEKERDLAPTREEALLEIYKRARPGEPL